MACSTGIPASGNHDAGRLVAVSRARVTALRIATGPSTVRQMTYVKIYAPAADRVPPIASTTVPGPA